MKLLKLLLCILVCSLSLTMTLANAQPVSDAMGNVSGSNETGVPVSGGACTQKSPDFTALESITKPLKSQLDSSLLTTFATVAKGLAGGLTGYALMLAGAILTVSLLSGIVKAISAQKPIGGVFMDVVIEAAIVGAILANYGLFVGFAVDVATTLNQAVGGNSPFDAIVTFASTFFKVIANVATSAFKSFYCLDLFSKGIVGIIFDGLITCILLFVAIVFVLLALGDILFALLLGPVLLGVGIIYGPIAIGVGLSSAFTKPWFDKWVGFMSGAAITQFVAYAVLALMGGVITGLAHVYDAGAGNWFAAQALGIALIAMMAGKIFQQVPSMASALVPSSTGSSGAGGGAAIAAAAGGVVAAGAAFKAGAAATSAASASGASSMQAAKAGIGAGASAGAAMKKLLSGKGGSQGGGSPGGASTKNSVPNSASEAAGTGARAQDSTDVLNRTSRSAVSDAMTRADARNNPPPAP